MCLDKMQHEKLLFYISLTSVSGSGADSVLCSLFGILYFRLEIIFLFRVLGFRFCLYTFFFEGFARLFPVFECLFCITGIKVTEMALMSEE